MLKRGILKAGVPLILLLGLWIACCAVAHASSMDAVWPESPGYDVRTDNSLVIDASNMDKGYVMVSEIPLSGENYNNYQVVTSDISSKYLPGILIGYISGVNVSKDGLSMEGSIVPAVDFAHLDTVLVITTLKETAEELSSQ